MTAAVRNLDALRMLPFFATLAPETFEKLTQTARIDRLRKGETLFRQGDKAQSVFVVVEGFIKLSRISIQGDETVIHIFGRGESIAESVAVLGDNHTTTAEATGPATVARLPANDVAQLAREAPDLALTILSESSAKIWALMDEIETLKAQTADQRVLRFLLSLCSSQSGPCNVRLPYNKGDIAASLGLKQETLSRSFARLKSSGITIEGRDARIAAAERLSAEIE
ncbi:MAG: Crp/Fnr family transcriptional regulator, partial [Beijerinckiaceae bacterium]|nr:Crp/Fnr family transcriptional regulator [Beijerinckiaceae bacterium]